MVKTIKDPRFIGYYDKPPKDMRRIGIAMGDPKYDIWTNGKSIFSDKMRWAKVSRMLEG